MSEATRHCEESLVWVVESCCKKLFAYLNRCCRATHIIPPLHAHDGRLVENSMQHSETLVFKYQLVFISGLGADARNLTSSLDLFSLHVLRENQRDVLSELSKIKTGMSFVIDRIHS